MLHFKKTVTSINFHFLKLLRNVLILKRAQLTITSHKRDLFSSYPKCRRQNGEVYAPPRTHTIQKPENQATLLLVPSIRARVVSRLASRERCQIKKEI